MARTPGARSQAKLALIKQIKQRLAKAYPDDYVANEETDLLSEDDIRHEYNPVVELALIAGNVNNLAEVRGAANKEVAQYLYPKLKSVDLRGTDGQGLTIQVVQFSGSQPQLEDAATPVPALIDAIDEDE